MPEPVVERFDAQDAVTADAVVEMWVNAGVLDREEAERRVDEVHLIARTGSQPLGVGTAYLAFQPQLRMELWHYRAFVAGEHRLGGLTWQLAIRGRVDLSERYVAGIDTRAPGLIYEVENQGLKRRFPEAYWAPTAMTYVGVNARGQDVRVHWFPGALAPPPPV
jgi:hypothetical protein